MSVFTSTKPTASAVNEDGSINVKMISQEINDTTREANTYTAVDTMKKKAIHTATSYDEFKNFVACAELKPLKAGEFDELGAKKSSWTMRQTYDGKGVGGGTTHGVRSDRRDEWERDRDKALAEGLLDNDADNNDGGGDGLKVKKKGITKRPPKDGNDFDKAWRKMSTLSKGDATVLANKRKDYLVKMVPIEQIPTLFKTEMDVNVMGYIIDLFCGGNENDVAFEWLKVISMCGRFSLNVNFLDDKQMTKIKGVFASLEGSDVAKLKKAFGC